MPENSLLPRVVFNMIVAWKLLPTPTASYPGGSLERYHERLVEYDMRNPSFVPLNMIVDWGEYEPAIRHWEALTRPAPEPSIDSRLNPRFVEWMMGLRDGHVTSQHNDLSTAQQLRILGNGVVPQQATLALSVLFERANVHDVLESP